MIKPKHINKGDTFGVISPSSPSENRSEVTRASEYLEGLGYNVVIGKNVNKTKGFVAASEEDRAADFNEMFRRDDIDAVFVTQGGYGAAQLMNLIDFDAVKNGELPIRLTRVTDKITYVLYWKLKDAQSHANLCKPALEKFYKRWTRCLITMPKIILGESVVEE